MPRKPKMPRTPKILPASSIHQSKSSERPKRANYSVAFTEGALTKRSPQNPPGICHHTDAKRHLQHSPQQLKAWFVREHLEDALLRNVEDAIKKPQFDQTNESFTQFCKELKELDQLFSNHYQSHLDSKELDQLFSKHYQSHLDSKMISFYNFSKTISYMLKDYPNLKKTVLDGEVTIMWDKNEYKTNPVKREFWAS